MYGLNIKRVCSKEKELLYIYVYVTKQWFTIWILKQRKAEEERVRKKEKSVWYLLYVNWLLSYYISSSSVYCWGLSSSLLCIELSIIIVVVLLIVLPLLRPVIVIISIDFYYMCIIAAAVLFEEEYVKLLCTRSN